MKKAIIIIVVVFLIIFAIIGSVLMLFNKEKNSISSADFDTIMTQKEFSVRDATHQFSDFGYMKQVHFATSVDESLQIDFYETKDDESAIRFFRQKREQMELSKGNVSAQTSAEFKNNAKFTLSSNGKYKVVSRINNTVIYVSADEVNKDTIKTILKEIGY